MTQYQSDDLFKLEVVDEAIEADKVGGWVSLGESLDLYQN